MDGGADLKCTYCNKAKEGLRRCPCLLAAYCDAECQGNHWSVHKIICDTTRNGRQQQQVRGYQQQTQGVAGVPQSDLKVLQDAMVRVATRSPQAAASILIGLVKTNPEVLYPATAALTKMQMQLQYLMQQRGGYHVSQPTTPKKQYQTPAPRMGEEGEGQMQARKHMLWAYHQGDWTGKPGMHGMQPMRHTTPDRYSTATRESSPLKSSLDLDQDDSLASSIASAILDD
eukprot:TRINITY_DN1062_c0_g1_i1.p1 TRINITY_DN1062_c0_g1~~TRINITY_DN1062_c0_g1_i1.p1  ORF type:complete len:255 (+),score=26.39 TRINITY_DN1062_c0_g1_i1:81-767(+)